MSNPDAAAMPQREALLALHPNSERDFMDRYGEPDDAFQLEAFLLECCKERGGFAPIVPLSAWAAMAGGLGLEVRLTHDASDSIIFVEIRGVDGLLFAAQGGGIPWHRGWLPHSPTATRALVLALLLAAAVKEAAG